MRLCSVLVLVWFEVDFGSVMIRSGPVWFGSVRFGFVSVLSVRFGLVWCDQYLVSLPFGSICVSFCFSYDGIPYVQ